MPRSAPSAPMVATLFRKFVWKEEARRLVHWLWAIFSTRTCSVGVAGWCSVMKSARRDQNSSGASLERNVVLEKKPWERRDLEEAALPSGVTGPVDFWALAWLASR